MTGTPLDALTKLSPRAKVGLRKAGYNTLEVCAAAKDEELLKLRGVAAASVQRIRAWQAGEPEADSVVTPSSDRQARIWVTYRELVTLRQLPPAQAYPQAVELVEAFDKLAGAKVVRG